MTDYGTYAWPGSVPSGTNTNVNVFDSAGVATNSVPGSVNVNITGGAVPSPTNTNGSIVNQALTGTTAHSSAPPANAVGFIFEAPSTNSDNVRWCVGGTASTTVGMLSEPGRDSGFIPCAATISVCAVASTTANAYSIQWVLSL